MGKRKAEPLDPIARMSDDDIYELCFCYYCTKEYAHIKALQDHMKSQHLFCEQCKKRLDSIGGLRTHVNSVHKLEFLGVPNSMPEDRGKPDGPEIYLMEGIPQQLKDDFYKGKFDKRDQLLHAHRMSLPGHSQTGDAERPSKQPKLDSNESKESRMARLREHKAKKAAEKKAAEEAAAKGGSENNNTNGDEAVTQGSGDSFAAQDTYIQFDQNDAPAQFGLPQPGYATHGYDGGFASSPPMGGMMMAQPQQQGYQYGGAGPRFGFAPSSYGQQSPFPQHYSNNTYPQQPAGYGGSPQGFPPQPMANPSPASRANNPAKSKNGSFSNGKSTTLAAPPGLPTKPSAAPNFSKEQMTKFHHGSGVSKAAPTATDSATSAIDDSRSAKTIAFPLNDGSGGHTMISPDKLDVKINQLLAEEIPTTANGETQPQQPVSKATSQKSMMPSCGEKTTVTTLPWTKGTLYKYTNNTQSPEEKKGSSQSHPTRKNKARRMVAADYF